MPISLEERFAGVLIGHLAGDALGAPYETWSAERIQADFNRRGGLVPFDYPDPFNPPGPLLPAGRPTDDSEMQAVLGDSLLACNGCLPEDQYVRYRILVGGGNSVLWEGKALGFGGTTRKVLAKPTYRESLDDPEVPMIASNGSLMRSAVVGLFAHRQPQLLTTIARVTSAVTHRHSLAGDCCVIYVHFLDQILRGFHIETAWERAVDVVRGDIREKEAQDLLDKPLSALRVAPAVPERNSVGDPRFSALYTLRVAVWAALRGRTFKECLELAISVGGDTDTYAAVAGALGGAYGGIYSISSEWRSVLKGRHRLELMAHVLNARVNEHRDPE